MLSRIILHTCSVLIYNNSLQKVRRASALYHKNELAPDSIARLQLEKKIHFVTLDRPLKR